MRARKIRCFRKWARATVPKQSNYIISLYIHTYAYVCMYMYACMCVSVYIYIHTIYFTFVHFFLSSIMFFNTAILLRRAIWKPPELISKLSKTHKLFHSNINNVFQTPIFFVSEINNNNKKLECHAVNKSHRHTHH